MKKRFAKSAFAVKELIGTDLLTQLISYRAERSGGIWEMSACRGAESAPANMGDGEFQKIHRSLFYCSILNFYGFL